MAESDNDSFILIQVTDNNGNKTVEQQLMFSNAQLTRSILSNKSNDKSVDGWSEISAPSVKSNKSLPKQTGNSFNVFSGTYLQSSAPMIGSMHNNNNSTNTNSDKGYYLINAGSQENVPVFSSNSTTNDEGQNGNNYNNNNTNNNNNNNNNNNSIGSIGSRVPFSWAEITKIQPQFHNENNKEVHKPKVFDQTPKIRTRYRSKIKKSDDNEEKKSISKSISSNNDDHNNNNTMPSISESDPSAIKGDLGRRVRRSGKRGSRLKYSNHRRGTKRNWRKKYQK